MDSSSGFVFLRYSDGASQQQRIARALDSDPFALDERTLRDLLEFARRHANTFRAFNSANPEAGDWSGFVDGDIDVLIAALNPPSPDELMYPYSRLALVLTFLGLLQTAEEKGEVQMNSITTGKLDSYYQQGVSSWRKTGVQPLPVPEIASLQALLAFARAHAGVLQSFVPKNRDAIDWPVILNSDTDALMTGLTTPVDPEYHQPRSHLPLFLVFLALLQRAQVQMDTITPDKLGFYYQKALYFRQKPGFELLRFRDGASQQQRISGFLDPASFALDERSLRDLLVFARRFAGTLKYFDRDNQEAGDWTAFLDVDLDTLIRYLKDPATLDDHPDKKDRYSQPHLALFLCFLTLLQRAQVQLNTITRRQLEFYYRQALGFRQKAGTPDRVHVLARLEDEVDELLIPEGALLFAGEDAAGEPVLYRAEEKLIANRAQVAQVMSLHVEKEVTTLFSIRESNEDESLLIPVFLEVLNLAYRETGTENTPRKYPNNQPSDRLLNEALIEDLDKVYTFITEKLQLRITAFQYIIELYKAWENESNWTRAETKKGINDYLVRASRKTGLVFADLRDFNANLEKALDIDIKGQKASSKDVADNVFKDLEGVADFYDLYTRYLLLKNTGGNLTNVAPVEPVIQKILDLNFAVADFEAMMKLRMDTLAYIRNIVRILRDAMTQPLPAGDALPDIATLLQLEQDGKLHLYYKKDQTLAALIKYVGRLNNADLAALTPAGVDFNDDFFSTIATKQLAEVEDYFRMPAEDFFFVRQMFIKHPGKNWEYNTPAWKWRRADELFKNAHRDIFLRPDITAFPDKDATPVPLSQLPAEPEIIRWKNVYLAREADRIIVPGFDEKEEYSRWKTFGKKPDPVAVPEEAELFEIGELGFVLTTPALQLAEGKRQLTLELTFEQSHFDHNRLNRFFNRLTVHLENVKSEMEKTPPGTVVAEKQKLAARTYYPFTIAISTEKKWVTIPDWTSFEITPKNDNDINDSKITITLLLNEEIDPLAPVDGDQCPSPWPALKLILNRDEIEAKDDQTDVVIERRRPYELFRELLLKSIRLSAAVTGLTQLQVQNREGSVDPQKPFEPFGPEPRSGERLFIAHPELAAHRLDSLTLTLNWDGLPLNLANYYAPYTTLGAAFKVSGLAASDFQPEVEVSIREAHRSLVLSLATASTDTLDAELKWDDKRPYVFTPNEVPYERKLNPKITDNLPDSDRYLQIELKSPDFQHNRYATLLAMTGANGGMTTEVLKVKTSGNPATSSIQFRGIPAQALATDDFTVKKVQDNLKIDINKYDPAKKELTLTQSIANDTAVEVSYQTLLLPEPYTPVVNSISAGYETSVIVDLSAERDSATDRLLYLHPFGMSDMEKSGEGLWVNEIMTENGQTRTVPKWYFRFLPRLDDEGQLFLGIENLRPPQTLSLLFQLAEGSSNPDLPQAKLEWACLAGEKWRVLGDEYVLHDTTNGLLNSGIIRLAVPADASLDHSLMPAGLHWIRISVRRFAESLSDTIAIHTQAVRAVWIDPGAEALQEARTLPPGSIAEPYEPIPGLLELVQPFSSFFGKAAEQAPAFYQRVSERLRHKNRALTMWDYERLVLENFPDIYKVKALATDLMDAGAPPGTITVVVIPDIRFRRPFNPFEPKVQQGRLKQIQDFLQQLAPPFVQVRVQNPRFDYLSVRVMVRFFDMTNFDFYADRLQREIKQYLSPWAFDDAGEITFGKDVNLSMLVYFMETRPYIDYVDKPVLTVLERRLSDGAIEAVQIGGTIQLRGPDVIFVSASTHTIDPLDDTIAPQDRIREGIGHAKIDLDFNIPRT